MNGVMAEKTRVLFITWDGPNSAYLEGLFLPIFRSLGRQGLDFNVLQFTWSGAYERAKLEKVCAAAGVGYRSVRVWRSPVAIGSFATALWGRFHVRKAIADFQIDVVMPRSTLPAVAGIPAAKALPLMLDADGLPNDERVEFHGRRPRGLSYRALRRLEMWAIRRADLVVVRTRRAIEILAKRTGVEQARFHVVANGRDPKVFDVMSRQAREASRVELEIGAAPLLVYAGSSLTGKYLGEAIFVYFREVLKRRPDSRLLLLMPCQEEARWMISRNSDLAAACILRSATHHEVPQWLACADLGLSLIRQTLSMQAASAIKTAEYLLCGVPVLATAGVGEVDTVVGPEVGFCLHRAGEADLAAAADWFVDGVLADRPGFRRRCRSAGLKHFSLAISVKQYRIAFSEALSNAAVRGERSFGLFPRE
jgi:glycosyltransferase involved in cell wall biosynthesis